MDLEKIKEAAARQAARKLSMAATGPASTVTLDALVGYRTKKWEVNVNVTNVTNKEIWNKGSFYWIDPKFIRAVELTYIRRF